MSVEQIATALSEIGINVVFRTQSTKDVLAQLKATTIHALDLAVVDVKHLASNIILSDQVQALDLAAHHLPQPMSTFKNAVRYLRGSSTGVDLEVFDVYFSLLPQELQDRVWTNAIIDNCEPRMIKVREIEDPAEYDEHGNVIPFRGSQYEAEGAPVPEWLRLAGPHITKIAITEGIYEPIRIYGRRSSAYFRTDLDILQLSTTRNVRSAPFPLRLCDVVQDPNIPNQKPIVDGQAGLDLLFHAGRMVEDPGKPITKLAYLKKDPKVLNPGLFARIRHLEIEAQSILNPRGCDLNWLTANLLSMPGLLAMTFATDIALLPGHQAPDVYRMLWEPAVHVGISGTHYVPVHRANGLTLADQPARDHMVNAISDLVERGRYSNMNDIIHMLNLNVKYMPLCLAMVTEYYVLDFGYNFY